jgi:hypothetical protein
VVALNKPDFGNFAEVSNSPACGQCIQVTGPNGTVQVQVVDMVSRTSLFFMDESWFNDHIEKGESTDRLHIHSFVVSLVPRV